MAKLLFLFGAGASAHSGTPLMKGFLNRVYDLAVTRNSHFTTITDLVTELEILHSRSSVDLGNIESIFNLVEMAGIIDRLPKPDGVSIPDVASALRRVICETLDCTCRFPTPNGHLQAPADYSRFARFLNGKNKRNQRLQCSILTFNYDVGLEFALQRQGLEFSYCFPEQQDRSIPLLKLHGSLNWGLCECGKLGAILPSRIREMLDETSFGRSPHVTIPVSDLVAKVQHCPERPFNGPAIVPPSWNKGQHYGNFSHIWKRAAQELAAAENIVVVGYSMPQTDPFFRELFALGMNPHTRLKHFIVADPDKGVEERYRQLLGPTVRDVFQFWDQDFRFAIQRMVDFDWWDGL